MDKVIVVAGPTASGKTGLGIALAQSCNGEIVSADSMQVYRGMDIGTAKATAEEQAQAVHHMLDVAEPEDNYSVSLYVQQAEAVCQDIIRRGKRPIIVGGTGLYIDFLLRGTSFAPAPEDPALRQALTEEYRTLGGEAMLARLAQFDPRRAARLSPADGRRIVRAIEIYMLSGITATRHDELSQLQPPRFDAAYLVLNDSRRECLYQRIDRRVDRMVEMGLFEEVSSLLNRGVSEHCTSMQGIGYKETAMALRGDISREDAVSLIKQGSRRYAKRQMTWFRRRTDALHITWENGPDLTLARQLSREFFAQKGLS